MKKSRKHLIEGICFLIGFLFWTLIIQCVDVQNVGPKSSKVGLALINVWFHKLTGVHMNIYQITDWLGLVPIVICMCFGVIGLKQWICRRSICRVDVDIILLGIYYVLVILMYLVFEMIPINYRPVLINGVLEASYPSSTTLLVMGVMPTLAFQMKSRINNCFARKTAEVFAASFMLFMVIGRLISGVHWLTDIVGAILLSVGLFQLYVSAVLRFDEKGEGQWNLEKN